MEEKSLGNNTIFTVVKLFLFLVIFCFLFEITKNFWRIIRSAEGFDLSVFIFSMFFPFAFSAFVVDLNTPYKKIQNFFYRSTAVALFFPSFLILLSLSYFLIPKILQTSFNHDLFIFFGGFTFISHLIFVAQQTRGQTFSTVINYLFMFSILFILNLILLGLYLRIGFTFHLGSMLIEGVKNGASLLKNIFTQAFN